MNQYVDEYRRKLASPAEAAALIPNGATIIHGAMAAEPEALLCAIADRAHAGDLRGLHIYSLNPQAHAGRSYMSVDLCDCIECHSWFVSEAARRQASVGLVRFIPSYMHQLPRFVQEHIAVDVALTTVSPMDNAGYFSFGTANDMTSTAARKAEMLLVEVNPNMPRVFGDSLVHVSEVAGIVENDAPILELPPPAPRPEDAVIGQAIAKLIPDGGVLQLGIGGLPNAIAPFLGDRKDLGIHTELIGPGMVELIKQGVVTGRRKTLHPRKHVFTLAIGVRSTYEFLNDNPSMESYPASYVTDPAVIAQNDNMVAVNSILEVDLMGQCNAETLDGFQFSGTGGQLDFVRGAYASRGGISVLAFYATAKKGQVSRVVPRLRAGTMVTTPRCDVQYLATEFGIVNLKQKSLAERALAIISIAHPRFRDDLIREAEHMRIM